tara:strand:- start:1335 stop:1508 length:174 start_codon:yes stop_codon:yes gene_type:complete
MVQDRNCRGCTPDPSDSYLLSESMTGYPAPAAWGENWTNVNMVDTGPIDKFDSFLIE